MAEDIGALVVRIEANLKNFDSGINNVSNKIDKFGSSVKKIGGLIAGAFAVKAITDFGKEMLITASDAEEMQSKFNTVFDNMSSDAEAWATNFRKRVGGSRVEIKGMIADSQDMLTGFGATTEKAFDLSTKMQELGTDLASFQNISGGSQEAVERLRKGLLGEHENLKALGIIINQTALEQELSLRGDKRKLKDLSELEKIELRYAIAVKQSKNAIGDAEKTSGGFANQLRNLKGQVKDVTAKLGSYLLPIATKVITFINEQIPNMEQYIITGFQNIGNIIKPIYETIMPLLQQGFEFFTNNIIPLFQERMDLLSNTVIPFLMEIFNKLTNIIMPPLQRIFEIFINDIFPKLNDAVMFFVENIYPILAEAFNLIVDKIIPRVVKIIEYLATEIIPLLADKVKKWIPIIVEIFQGLWEGIKIVIDLIVAIFDWAWPYLKDIINGAIKVIVKVIDGLLKAIKGIIDFVVGIFTGDWKRAWEGIKNIFGGIWDAIKSILNGLIDSFKYIFGKLINSAVSFGKDIVNGLINGIKSKINEAKETAKNIANSIKNGITGLLKIKSPSKVMEEIGKNISDGLSIGISDNAKKAIYAAEDMARNIIEKYDKFGDQVMIALKTKYQKEEELQLNSLQNQTDNIRKQTDKRLALYDKELAAKLRILDDGTNEEIRALQERIDNINAKTQAEEEAIQQAEYESRLADKRKKLSEAESAEERSKIQQELNEMITEHERKELLKSRQNEISKLRDEMDSIRENAESKRKELEKEAQEKKRIEEEKANATILALNKEMNATKQHYKTLLEEDNLQAEARNLILNENNQELIDLLSTYNSKWQNAGQSFGESLINGLNSTKTSVEQAVNDMLSLIGKGTNKEQIYTVKAGDTLSAIATRFNTTIGAIAKLNNITDVNLIRTGQTLRIPKLAKGTNYFNGGLAMVGEMGRELVKLPKGSQVIPNKKTEEILSSSTMNFERMFEGANFYVRSDNDIKTLARELFNLQQSRGRGNGVVTTT